MSWSFSATGKAAAVRRSIEMHHNNTLTGKSGEEWAGARCALLTIIDANVGGPPIVVAANGSGSYDYKGTGEPQERVSGQCSVSVVPLSGWVE